MTRNPGSYFWFYVRRTGLSAAGGPLVPLVVISLRLGIVRAEGHLGSLGRLWRRSGCRAHGGWLLLLWCVCLLCRVLNVVVVLRCWGEYLRIGLLHRMHLRLHLLLEWMLLHLMHLLLLHLMMLLHLVLLLRLEQMLRHLLLVSLLHLLHLLLLLLLHLLYSLMWRRCLLHLHLRHLLLLLHLRVHLTDLWLHLRMCCLHLMLLLLRCLLLLLRCLLLLLAFGLVHPHQMMPCPWMPQPGSLREQLDGTVLVFRNSDTVLVVLTQAALSLRVALFSCLLEAAHGIQFIDRHADTSMMSQPDPTQRDRNSLLRSLTEVLDGLTGIRFDT